VGKWVRIDRRYNNPYRLTGYAKRVITTWVVIVIVVIILVDATRGWFAIPAGLALAGYAGYRVRSRRQVLPAGRPPVQPAATFGTPAPVGERNTRSIPQDVKIAVAVRDGGRCRQCGSTADLHYDHVIPWSKGGANTVANIQLLCGPCNRRKGADDIPVTI
jgi:HNH endonuclease